MYVRKSIYEKQQTLNQHNHLSLYIESAHHQQQGPVVQARGSS